MANIFRSLIDIITPNSPAEDFLDAYSRERQYFLSLPSLWKIEFNYTGNPNLWSHINETLEKAGERWRVQSVPAAFTKNGNVLVAREVTVPPETTSFLTPGGEINKGGYLPGFGVDQRANFASRNLVVNFFDTIGDIEHTFFRPWMIAIGIDGLIGRAIGKSLLCNNVVLRQYDNLGGVRKGYQFDDIFPTNVEGYTLNYDGEDYAEKSVTFAFKNYRPYVSGGGSGGGSAGNIGRRAGLGLGRKLFQPREEVGQKWHPRGFIKSPRRTPRSFE